MRSAEDFDCGTAIHSMSTHNRSSPALILSLKSHFQIRYFCIGYCFGTFGIGRDLGIKRHIRPYERSVRPASGIQVDMNVFIAGNLGCCAERCHDEYHIRDRITSVFRLPKHIVVITVGALIQIVGIPLPTRAGIVFLFLAEFVKSDMRDWLLSAPLPTGIDKITASSGVQVNRAIVRSICIAWGSFMICG